MENKRDSDEDVVMRSEERVSLFPRNLVEKSTTYKIAWLLALFLSISLFGWHFSTLIDKYNENSIETTIQQSSVPFDFPELLICNNLVTSYSNVVRHANEMNNFLETFLTPIMANSSARGFPSLIDWLKIIGSTADSKVMMPIYGHDIGEMLLLCQYGDFACSTDDFEEYFHDTYLRCWRFLPKNNNISSYKLDIMLYSDTFMVKQPMLQLQGIPFSSVRFDGTVRWDISGGINLYIYPSGVAPIEATRIQIGTGNEVQIRLSQMDLSGQNSAQKPCETNTTQKVVYKDIDGVKQLNYTYNIEDCYKNALLKELERQCGCFPKTRIPTSFNITGKGKCYDYNAVNNGPDMLRRTNCMESVYAQEDTIYIKSNCLNSCNRRYYTPTVSSVEWPLNEAVTNTVNQFVKPNYQKLLAKGYYSFGLQHFINKSEEFVKALNIIYYIPTSNSLYYPLLFDVEKKYTDLLRDFRSNFLRLKIYAEESKGTLMEENFSYTLVSLLSDFGGIIGMYIDVCLLSIIIFMDYFYSLYKFSLFKIRKREFSLFKNSSAEKKNISDGSIQKAIKLAW